MKILKHGVAPNTTHVFVCSNCHCIFEAGLGEYRSGGQYNETFYLADCPECGNAAAEHKGEEVK